MLHFVSFCLKKQIHFPAYSREKIQLTDKKLTNNIIGKPEAERIAEKTVSLNSLRRGLIMTVTTMGWAGLISPFSKNISRITTLKFGVTFECNASKQFYSLIETHHHYANYYHTVIAAPAHSVKIGFEMVFRKHIKRVYKNILN